MSFTRLILKYQRCKISKNPRSLIFNQSGFSIVGVLIAASVGSFVVLGLIKSQVYLMKNTKKIESKMIALELTKEIISTLEAPSPDCIPPCTWSRSSCTNTLRGFNDVAGTETVKTAILSATHQINQPTPSDVYSVSENYNGVQIKEMKVIAEDTDDDVVVLRIWFETDEDVEQGRISPEMARPFDIYAKVNYVANSEVVESCSAVIASYSTFRGKVCSDGEYLNGFDDMGMIECIPLPECGDGEYLKGFDSSGNKICKFSQSGQECPPDQYLSGFDSDGQMICRQLQVDNQCPPNQVWSASCNKCVSNCNSSQVFDAVSCTCKNRCASGVYVASTNKCYKCNNNDYNGKWHSNTMQYMCYKKGKICDMQAVSSCSSIASSILNEIPPLVNRQPEDPRYCSEYINTVYAICTSRCRAILSEANAEIIQQSYFTTVPYDSRNRQGSKCKDATSVNCTCYGTLNTPTSGISTMSDPLF